MRVEPLNIEPILDRLAEATTSFRLIGRAVDNTNAIEQGPKVSPSLFVLEPTYRAEGRPNASGGGFIAQLCQWQIPVLTCIRQYGEATATRASAEATRVRKELWSALIGFDPSATKDGFAMQADSGRLVAYRNSTFYFVDVFRLPVQLRNLET